MNQNKLEEYLALHPNALATSDESDSSESDDNEGSSSSVRKKYLSPPIICYIFKKIISGF